MPQARAGQRPGQGPTCAQVAEDSTPDQDEERSAPERPSVSCRTAQPQCARPTHAHPQWVRLHLFWVRLPAVTNESSSCVVRGSAWPPSSRRGGTRCQHHAGSAKFPIVYTSCVTESRRSCGEEERVSEHMPLCLSLPFVSKRRQQAAPTQCGRRTTPLAGAGSTCVPAAAT